MYFAMKVLTFCQRSRTDSTQYFLSNCYNDVSLLYIQGFRPQWCISTIYRGFPTTMVYLYYVILARVSDHNGVSLLYIEGFRPEWRIATIYRGFPTRMAYRYYISRVSDHNGVSLLYIEGFRPQWCISTIYRGMVYLYYISRVSDQNGVSLLYIEGFRPEWCISTIYRGFPTKMVYLCYIIIMLEIHHSGGEPSISCLRQTILVGNPRISANVNVILKFQKRDYTPLKLIPEKILVVVDVFYSFFLTGRLAEGVVTKHLHTKKGNSDTCTSP